MYLLVIIYFLIISYLLGASVALLTKYKGKDLFEDSLMRLAIGLGVFPILTIIFNWIKIVDWKAYFIISIIVPVIWLFKKHKDEESKDKFTFSIKKTHMYYAALILLFVVNMFVYATGAFTYPYLEDGDPLSHAYASKYISETHTYSTPVDYRITHYLEPYPPFYSALMSLFLNFAKFDVVWVLKAINALIISLGVLFMFFLVKKLTGSNAKALVGALLLVAINSYVSHFIFSASYATTMIIPAIYFLIHSDKMHEKNEKINSEKSKMWNLTKLNWASIILASIIVSSVFLIQPIAAGIFALFLAIYFLCNISKKKMQSTKAVFFIILIGLALSQLFWIPAISKYGINTTAEVLGFGMFLNAPGGINNDSSGGVIYKFVDFMGAPIANKIDQPTGVGVVLFLIFIVSAIILIWKIKSILKSESDYSKFALPLLIWTALLVILIMGNALPYKFVPHRLWAFFSIGVILVTMLGGAILLKSIKNKPLQTGIVLLFIIGVIFTSFIPKYQVQTSYWPPGPEYKSLDELQGYLAMAEQVPKNTAVFAFCSGNEKVASSNMKPIYFNKELDTLKKNITLASSENYSVSNTLKNAGVEHIIVDTECASTLGINETNNLLNKLREEQFVPVIANNGFFLLRVS